MTYSESYTIEKHAQLVFISAFLSPYDELFNIKQNFKMKKYMPLEGLRWSRDSGSALYDTPQTAVLGRAGGQNANTLVTNRMPFDTYNLSAELRISKGVMKGQCLFMSLSQ